MHALGPLRRFPRRRLALVAIAAAATLAPGALSAGTARLEGHYQTFTEILTVRNDTGVTPGETSLKRWTYLRRCPPVGACVTFLLRPSILAAKRLFVYKLRALSATRYQGRLNVLDSCTLTYPNGVVSVLPQSFVDRETLTLRVTAASNGRATAYVGTLVIRSIPLALARAHGCTRTGYQLIAFKSPA